MPIVKLSFVPPGGGEQEWMLDADLPGIPRAGDALSIHRTGHHAFIVRSVRWIVRAEGGAPHPSECYVFAEYAESPMDGEEHKRSLARFRAEGLEPKPFPNDGH